MGLKIRHCEDEERDAGLKPGIGASQATKSFLLRRFGGRRGGSGR